MGALLKGLWKDRGLSPAWFDGLTPFEIVFLFAAGEKRTSSVDDPLAHLTRVNRERAERGELPFVPRWLFRRGGKQWRKKTSSPASGSKSLSSVSTRPKPRSMRSPKK